MALLAVPAAGIAADLQFTGIARTREGAPLYVESHYVRNAGEVGESRIVLYRCREGGPAFARKELSYGKRREEPEFTFTDGRTGYVEGLRLTPQGPRVFQQENSRSARREARIPTNVALVADAGFDELVRKHWDELEAGNPVRFSFLVPSRLDHLGFKVRKHHETRIDGAAASVIRLNLSGMFGWFLPHIDVTYRKSDRVLLRYDGISNIRDEQGGNHVAVIDFPLRERRSVPAVDLLRLKAEPLVSRC